MSDTRRTFERSGLTDASDAYRYKVELNQKPLAAWFMLLFAISFVAVCAGIIMEDPGSPVSPVAQGVQGGLVLVPFVLMALGSFYKGKVSILATATELEVAGWIGRFPRPRRVRVSLDSVQCETHRGVAINGTRTFLLYVEGNGERLRLPGLACTEREVDQVAADLEALGKQARAKIGEGTAEIPDALEALVSERARSEEERE